MVEYENYKSQLKGLISKSVYNIGVLGYFKYIYFSILKFPPYSSLKDYVSDSSLFPINVELDRERYSFVVNELVKKIFKKENIISKISEINLSVGNEEILSLDDIINVYLSFFNKAVYLNYKVTDVIDDNISDKVVEYISDRINSGCVINGLELSEEFTPDIINNLCREITSSRKNIGTDSIFKLFDGEHLYLDGQINLINFINGLLKKLSNENKIKLESKYDVKKSLYHLTMKECYTNPIRKYKAIMSKTVYAKEDILFDLKKVHNQLVRKILKDVIYKSARNKPEIFYYSNIGILLIDDVVVPVDFVKELFSDFEVVLSKAINNYYWFLSDIDLSFFEKYNNYSIKIDNIHILGLDNKISKIYKYFNSHLTNGSFRDLFSFLDNFLDKLSNNTDYNILEICNDNYSIDDKIRILNRMKQERLKGLNISDDNDRIKLLVYFYKKFFSSSSNKDPLFKVLLIKRIKYILESFSYIFGQNFIKDFSENSKSICSLFCTLYENDSLLDNIINEYDNYFEQQNDMRYLYLIVVREILKQIEAKNLSFENFEKYFKDEQVTKSFKYSENETELFKNLKFSYKDNEFIIKDNDNVVCKVKLSYDKHIIDIYDNQDGCEFLRLDDKNLKLKNNYGEEYIIEFNKNKVKFTYTKMGMNLFSLADAYICANYNQFVNELDNNAFNINCDINLFKVFDKCLYLNNINFVTDIENIYVTDLQNLNVYSFIFEMKTSNDDIHVVFDYGNSDADFVSIQNAEILLSLNYFVPYLSNLCDFHSTGYKTIIGFAEKSNLGFSNILSQSNSDFRQKKYSRNDFIKLLRDRKVVLRHATAIDRALSNVLIDNFNLNNILNNNITGCMAVLSWLDFINAEDFQKFTKNYFILTNDNVDFLLIKSLLYRNVIQELKEIADRLYNNSTSDVIYNNLCKFLSEIKLSMIDNIIELLSGDLNDISQYINSLSDIEFSSFIYNLRINYPLYFVKLLRTKIAKLPCADNRIVEVREAIKKRIDSEFSCSIVNKFRNIVLDFSDEFDIINSKIKINEDFILDYYNSQISEDDLSFLLKVYFNLLNLYKQKINLLSVNARENFKAMYDVDKSITESVLSSIKNNIWVYFAKDSIIRKEIEHTKKNFHKSFELLSYLRGYYNNFVIEQDNLSLGTLIELIEGRKSNDCHSARLT